MSNSHCDSGPSVNILVDTRLLETKHVQNLQILKWSLEKINMVCRKLYKIMRNNVNIFFPKRHQTHHNSLVLSFMKHLRTVSATAPELIGEYNSHPFIMLRFSAQSMLGYLARCWSSERASGLQTHDPKSTLISLCFPSTQCLLTQLPFQFHTVIIQYVVSSSPLLPADILTYHSR